MFHLDSFFVYNDLCPTAELRENLEDVQLHPVKMMVFVKFKSEQVRDQVVANMLTMNGILWSEYGVKVKGRSLDSKVKVITILGASPETTSAEIKTAFVEAEIGEVVELDRGFLDQRRLPGVTNGKWVARVKIEDPDKQIPSYIIRKEEGELWSLNFEGRRFVCWKCGSPDHIGDKCKDQEKTFEEVFGDNVRESPVSWAAIVKGTGGVDQEIVVKRDAFAKQIRENNERKSREKREAEERKQQELEEKERLRRENELERQRAVTEVAEQVQQFGDGDDSHLVDAADDIVLVHMVQEHEELTNPVDVPVLPALPPRGPVQGQGGGGERGGGGDEGLDNGSGGGIGRSLVIDRIDSSLLGTGQGPDPSSLQSLLVAENVPRLGGRSFQLDTSLERAFGRGATMLAIEFEGGSKSSSSSDSSSDSEEGMSVITPDREDVRKKRMRVGRDERFGDLSGISGVGDHQLSCSEGEYLKMG
jgi:hypothetical protein